MLAKPLQNKAKRARARWRARRPSVFGNALGNAIVGGIEAARTRRLQRELDATMAKASQKIMDDFWAQQDANLAADLNAQTNINLARGAGASNPAFRKGPSANDVEGLYGSVGLNKSGRPVGVDVNVPEGSYQLTDAQIDMLTYVGHITRKESGYLYREGLGVPYGGMTDAQRAAWRANYFAVDRVIQDVDQHGHTVLRASTPTAPQEDLPVNTVDAIGWSINKGMDDVVANIHYSTTNANNGFEAGIGATSYAVTKVVQPIVHSVGGLFRFAGNNDYRVNTVLGAMNTFAHPVDAFHAWNAQDRDDKLGQIGAMFAGGIGGMRSLSAELNGAGTASRLGFRGARAVDDWGPFTSVNVESAAARRTYLNEKFGRTGIIDVDINIRGNQATVLRYASDMGLDEGSAQSLMSGIDLSQPVDIVRLNRGKPMWQYQAPGAPQGGWYASSPDVLPWELGISPYGMNRATSSVELRVLNSYRTNTPVDILRSTARPIDDFWSIPYGTFQTKGGGIQWFSPNKNAFTLMHR